MRWINIGLILAIFSVAKPPSAVGQVPVFQQTVMVGIKDPVILDIAVSKGDVSIGYRRDGQVSIYASGKDAAGKNMTEEFFKNTLIIEQKESRVIIRNASNAALDPAASISYAIDVPFRTEVTSSVSGSGKQKVIGIAGPAKLTSGSGDIEAIYVTLAAVKATTGKGNISCSRVAEVNAETGGGRITLAEDGPSRAVIKKGPGMIDVGGARGSFEGLTDSGDLHIKSVLNGDWQLNSASGSIKIEVPPKAKFEVDASTLSGRIFVEYEEMQEPINGVRQIHQEVNGGGKHIHARSISGNISIQ